MTDMKDIKDMPDGLIKDGKFFPISVETWSDVWGAGLVATMRAQRTEPRAE